MIKGHLRKKGAGKADCQRASWIRKILPKKKGEGGHSFLALLCTWSKRRTKNGVRDGAQLQRPVSK